MPSEFPQFTNLPAKIRHEIWRCALQPISPARPRAHFFSVTNYGEDGDMLKKLRVQCNLGSDCEINHGCHYCLAAPKFGSSNSWTSNNPSAYVWDFGMFGACHESREIIEKHYRIEYWTAKLRQGRPEDHSDHPVDTCVPFIYPRAGGDWCFPIHPNQDLVCLQPFDANTVGFYRRNPYFIEDFCMVEWGRGLRGFANLALEYNSSWYDDFDKIHHPLDLFEEMSPRGLFLRTLVCMVDDDMVYAPKTLWLIDNSLKRKEGSDRIPSKESKVFNGSDKKFVQVDLNSHDYSDTWSCSALDFVSQIEMLFSCINPTHFCLGHSWDVPGCNGCDEGGGGTFYIEHHVQVLACEKTE